MKIQQQKWTTAGWKKLSGEDIDANLVLVFGGREALSDAERYNELKSFYPNANILLGSTSGEILDIEVSDETIAVTAICFEHTKMKIAKLSGEEISNSNSAAKNLAGQLIADDLKYVFVLSDGLKVNGSELVKGFNEALPNHIIVTGGLAGDAANFQKSLVGINAAPKEGNIVAIGFYGDKLKIGHGSKGGWDPFGPERHVTKSQGNVLFELDGQSALELYKTYLGDKASSLPGSGLLFPLNLKIDAGSSPVVRTLLAVDEAAGSMTFAGDIPAGSIVQLMKANFDKLIDASSDAAESTTVDIAAGDADLAILVSCVGRKLVLGQRIEEEVEEAREVLGEKTKITGFYSYGEISPLTPNVNCELHNQTMTITTFTES